MWKVLEPANTFPCHECSDFTVCPVRGATRSWAYVLEDAGCLSVNTSFTDAAQTTKGLYPFSNSSVLRDISG